jgi:hypothetical protein
MMRAICSSRHVVPQAKVQRIDHAVPINLANPAGSSSILGTLTVAFILALHWISGDLKACLDHKFCLIAASILKRLQREHGLMTSLTKYKYAF